MQHRCSGRVRWEEWKQASARLEGGKASTRLEAKKASTWTAVAQRSNVFSEGFFAARRVAFAASPMLLLKRLRAVGQGMVRVHGQEMVRGWSGDGQGGEGMVKGMRQSLSAYHTTFSARR